MESLDIASLREIQLLKLQRLLVRVYETSAYYNEKFRRADVNPHKFRTWEDYSAYPFFDKDEERASQEQSRQVYGHPFGMHICCNPRSIQRVSASSGTTGTPTYGGYTRRDREIFFENSNRAYVRMDLVPGDRVLFAGVMSMWVGGVPFIDGLLNYGACVIPVGALSGVERVAQTAADTRPDLMLCTPSFALYLIEKIPERTNLNPRDFGIKKICVYGEPGGSIKEIYSRISEGFGGAETYDISGGTGTHSPLAISCEAHAGMHYFADDNALLEIVDPKSLQPLPLEDGVEGEMVFTGLERDCGPLVRWRDKDIVRVTTAPCECGRPGYRLEFRGRSDDMLLVKGVNVFPNAVRDVVIRTSSEVTENVRIVKRTASPVVEPPVEINVELKSETTEDQKLTISRAIEAALHAALHFRASVRLFDRGQLKVEYGATGKLRILDKRY
jgi:phenylacetate-CoA ligase